MALLLLSPLPAQGGDGSVDFRDEALRIAQDSELSLVIWNDVQGRVSPPRQQTSPLDSLRDLASQLGSGIQCDEYGVLIVSHRALPQSMLAELRATGVGETSMTFSGVSVQECILEITRPSRTSTIIGPNVEGTVTASIDALDWRAALNTILPQGSVLSERGTVARIMQVRQRAADAPRMRFVAQDADAVLRSIAAIGEQKLLIGLPMQGKLTMDLRGVPWSHALRLAADAVGAYGVRDREGRYILREWSMVPEAVSPRVVLHARSAPMGDLLRSLAREIGCSVDLSRIEDRLDTPITSRFDGHPFQAILEICDVCEVDVIELEDGALRLEARA